MTFPVYINAFGYALHPHVLFELLGYSAGFQAYLLLRRRGGAVHVPAEAAMWILVGCVAGALVGSKLLTWAEAWPEYWARRGDWRTWLGGKTIVGGLLGGWAGVEIVKNVLGIRHRTGDGYALPLCLGIAVGRVGCFLTGLADHTHGAASALPWSVDFGDGVRRHPTQLYEIVWLILLGALIWLLPFRGKSGAGRGREPISDRAEPPSSYAASGMKFRVFVVGYMLFRFGVEFIKPSWKGYVGLSAIQWAALAAAAMAIISAFGNRPRERHEEDAAQSPLV
ncbi:MAG TPA: prolipoprotein diacylglyceryl transferase family protein [Tepidisphaeraceae bacterium]|jgi:prolipoprotein diacylglyceryltransferase